MAGARITYGGNTYVLRDDPVFQGITEFNTAIRLGRASNDDRQLASFLSFEDGRGGIGSVVGDTREDLDKLADSDGLVLFKIAQAIKPFKMNTVALSGATKSLATHSVLRELQVDATTRMYLGFGHQLWYSNGTTAALTKTTADPFSSGQKISSIVTYTNPVSGVKRCFIGNEDNQDIRFFTDPTGATPFTTVGSSIKGEMLFSWDGKFWAGERGVLKWSITPETGSFTVAAASGGWPNRWRFIGVFPFGLTAYPYVIVNHHDPSIAEVAVLDLDTNTVIPLTLGVTGIIDAFPSQGQIGIVFNRGRDAMIYDPAGRVRRELDWRAQDRDGFVSERDCVAAGGCDFQRGPILFTNLDDSTEAQVFLHKGTGWLPYGIKVSGDTIRGGNWIPHLQSFVMPIVPAGADLELRHIKWWNEAFVPGTDQSDDFEPANVSAITPWLDAGFSDISGALLAISHGGFADANNTVRIEYQTDFDTSAWVLLGTFPNTTPGEPEITGRSRPVQNTRTMLFNQLSGVRFRVVRFRYTLISSASYPRQSPNAYPLTLRFFKRPDLRESIRLAINVDDTLALRGGGDVVSVDMLMAELKALYDLGLVPRLIIGGITTWALMIAFPRVVELADIGDEDVASNEVAKGLDIVLNVAELM